MGRIGRRALAISIAAPGRVLVVGLVLAVAGWVAGTRAEVISDLRELVPSDLPELQNVDQLQDDHRRRPARSTSRCAPTTSPTPRWSPG